MTRQRSGEFVYMLAMTFSLPKVVEAHSDETSFEWFQRNESTTEPHYLLLDLCEVDSNLESQLDGLNVAGFSAWQFVIKNLENAESGEVFTAAWFALTFHDGKKLDQVIDVVVNAEEQVPLIKAFISALCWCPNDVVKPWFDVAINSPDPLLQYMVIAAHGLRREDCGGALRDKIFSSHKYVAARALRAAGELGRRDLVDDVKGFHKDSHSGKRFWSLWSSCLLGDVRSADQLRSFVYENANYCEKALNLYCRVSSVKECTALLRQLAQNEDTRRLAIKGAGFSGNPFWIPGLIRFMHDSDLARVAGEAVSMITGLDLKYLDLDQDEPEGFESGPNDDPDDENVELDEDDFLPWPNPVLLAKWWNENNGKYHANRRYLCGQPIDRSTCKQVLVKGYQRQRAAAALELALMGEPYFNVCQSGITQKRLLMPN